MIKNFNGFTEPQSQKKDSAGVVILLHQENESTKILLVHPTNGSWTRPIMGIPKGKMEEGEDVVDAALRELHEETGISLDQNQLDQGVHTVEVWKDQIFKNNIHYVICQIENPIEIGLSSIKIPKTQLQSDELDWAGFIEIDKAYEMIAASQRIILDRVR